MRRIGHNARAHRMEAPPSLQLFVLTHMLQLERAPASTKQRRFYGAPPALPSASSETSSWEAFFKRNAANFFKDRHYIDHAYPALWTDLQSRPFRVLDLGCGVGNTALPLLEQCPLVTLAAYDCSAEAVALLQADARFDRARATAAVADIASPSFAPQASSFDLALLMFVLSAIPSAAMERVVQTAATALKPGGRLLLRDYAEGDLAESRFRASSYVGRRTFARGDGSLSCFFSLAGLDALLRASGLCKQSAETLLRENVNHKRNLTMARLFVSVVYIKTF